MEVDGAVGDAHLSTDLRRLGRERGVWGVVMHGSSTGKVVAVCVVAEGRRRVKRRAFQVMAMAVRQEYKGRGLARQAMQRVQVRIGEEVVGMGGGKMRTGQGHGKSADGGYSLVAGLKSCMQREGVGLYRALGWSGTGESWEWSSDEHAAQGQYSVLTEESTKKKEGKSTAGRYREDMPTKGAEGETGQDDAQGTAQGAEADPRDMSLQATQQQLNEDEQGGEKCLCGRWEDYARVDGGWQLLTWSTNGGRQETMGVRT